MKTYLAVCSFNPRGEGGYDIYEWNDGKPTLAFSTLPEISAGIAHIAKNGIFYLTDERQKTGEGPGGRVYAARFEDGALVEINHSLSFGSAPSFCAVDGTGKYLLVTHFGSMSMPNRVSEAPVDAENGSVVLFRLNSDGSVGEKLDTFDCGAGSHAHSIRLAPDDGFFLVNDMGRDRLICFRIDYAAERLMPVIVFTLDDGDGPRYGAFHPTKPIFYANCEERPFVLSFRYDSDGNLTPVSKVRVLPEADTEPFDTQSGFALSSNGRFIYSAMRGKELISVLEADEIGELRLVQSYKLQGSRPKDLSISPDGKYIACANRGSDDIEIMSIGEDGLLSATDIKIEKKAAGLALFFMA